jgi:hypothetical protein
MTLTPRRASSHARVQPEIPPPMTIASHGRFDDLIFDIVPHHPLHLWIPVYEMVVYGKPSWLVR